MNKQEQNAGADKDKKATQDVTSGKTFGSAPDENSTPIDGDEKVHEQSTLPVNENEEQDFDDIVHRLPEDSHNSDLEDPDDKVHRIENMDEGEGI